MTRPTTRWWVWLAGLALLILGAVVTSLFWARRHPLELHEWTSRRALAKAGFERRIGEGPAGLTVRWEAGVGPALVFLHGAGHQAGAWAPVAPAFTSTYRVVVPDLPGHGESAPAAGPLPFDVVVEGLDDLVADEIEGPVILVGNSMGAWLASLQAYRHPGKVTRVVLVNGGPLRHVPEDLSLLPTDRAEARRLMTALRDPASPIIPDFVLDDIVRRGSHGPIGRLAAEWQTMEGFLLDGKLDELRTPVDLLWGASDRYMGNAYAERLVRELPRGRSTWLPACGHVPMSECPGRFIDELRAILAAEPPTQAAPETLEPTEDPA